MSLTISTIKDEFEVLQLNRGKANPINNDLVSAIRADLTRISGNSATRGVILTGNTPGYFSVGLDLKELFFYDEQQIMAFWSNWDAMVMELIKFPKPIIAAINGYSPAGGCVLAVTCDYRMMAAGEEFLIGLNEAAVGIVVPEYIFQLYSFWIGKRQAYHNLMRGRLMGVKEALECRLVDEVHEMNDLVPAAEAEMRRLLKAPDNILIHSKRNLRQELFDRLDSLPQVAVEKRLAAWFDPTSRAVMKSIVDSLTK